MTSDKERLKNLSGLLTRGPRSPPVRLEQLSIGSQVAWNRGREVSGGPCR